MNLVGDSEDYLKIKTPTGSRERVGVWQWSSISCDIRSERLSISPVYCRGIEDGAFEFDRVRDGLLLNLQKLDRRHSKPGKPCREAEVWIAE